VNVEDFPLLSTRKGKETDKKGKKKKKEETLPLFGVKKGT